VKAEQDVAEWLLVTLRGLVKAEQREGLEIEGGPGSRRDTGITYVFRVYPTDRDAFKLLLGSGGATMDLIRSLIRRVARAHDWPEVVDVHLVAPEVAARRRGKEA